MKVANMVKGQVAQTLVKLLFERAGYRVVRFGIEELFQEIVHLDAQRYSALGLPQPLRLLPDLLIADPALSKAFLVEVKFRREINLASLEELRETLSPQYASWPTMYTILLTSHGGTMDSTYHQDYIRVVCPDRRDLLTPSSFVLERSRPENLGWNVWKKLPALHEVFERFHWSSDEGAHVADVDFIAQSLRDLGALSEPSN